MKQRYLLPTGIVILLVGTLIIRGVASKKIQPTKHATALPKEVTVVLTKDGFTPQEVTVKVGSAVRWQNKSGDKETVNSDDYPTNQLHRELNFGVFNAGSSVVYIFTKSGIYGYHNQFHPEQNGKIIVE